MPTNSIKDVRPDSTFDSYRPLTDSQKEAMKCMANLSESLIERQAAFEGQENPMPHAGVMVLVGGVGVGKTHLIESVINDISQRAPNLRNRCFLQRGSLTTAVVGGSLERELTKTPILFVDDAYAEKQNLSDLSDFDIKSLMDFFTSVYEKRSLIIFTSNFPILSDTGLLERIRRIDKVGRITSRCKELIAVGGGEIFVNGPDYREIIAEEAIRRRKSPGDQQNAFKQLIPKF